MPIASPLSLKIGTIIDKTLGVIERNLVPVLAYIVVVGAANGVITYFALTMQRVTDVLVFWFAGVAVGIVAAYGLISAMISRLELGSRAHGDVFLAYCLMSLLSTLGVLAGLIAIVLPGLVIMARWSIAAPLMIARGGSATKVLGESWERTRGAEWQILMAWLALLVAPIAVMIACRWLFKPEDLVGIGVSQLASGAMSALILSSGVAIYGLLESGKGLTKTFA